MSCVLNQTRATLHTQTQESVTLARQVEVSTSREKDLMLEKETAVAHRIALEAQLGPLQERVNELQAHVNDIPNLQQSLERTRLEAEQVPALQEQLTHSFREIKSLELTLSTKEQEKKRLFNDLDAKRRRDISETKDACNLEAVKQVNDALTLHSKDWSNTLVDGLNALHVSSEKVTKQFFQACQTAIQDDCLADVFSYLQQLLDYIESEREERVTLLERLSQVNQLNEQWQMSEEKLHETERIGRIRINLSFVYFYIFLSAISSHSKHRH